MFFCNFCLFLISFKKVSRNFNGNILYFFVVSYTFGWAVGFGLGAGFGSGTSFSLNAGFGVSVFLPGACSGACSAVLFFVGNMFPVTLLRMFSLTLRNNPMFIIKGVFSTGFTTLFKRLIYYFTLHQHLLLSNFPRINVL